MSVIWYKVFYDLWRNKVRTLLTAVSIGAGVFAIGAMFGLSDQLLPTMDRAHQAVHPSQISITLTEPIDRETADGLKHIKGVEGVQAYSQVTVKFKVHPEDDWQQGVVEMRDDYDAQQYQVVQLKEGRWPGGGSLGIERLTAQYINLGIGDQVIMKIGNSERSFKISGKIRHPFVPPPEIFKLFWFFTDASGMERFDIPSGKFNSLFINVTPYSEELAKQVAAEVKDQLASAHIGIDQVSYQDPNKHWGRLYMEGFTIVLQVLAIISLFMSVILVYNTVNALITQQTNQIGIIKAIGGRSDTITKVYLTGILVYGLLALVIAVPAGAWVAFSIAHYFLNLFNIDYNDFEISRLALVLQVIAAISVPLLAGLGPVFRGIGLTVREAISSYGLGGDFGTSRFDQTIEKLGRRWLPSHYATALGNMFRRKGRLVLTQIVLVTAGAMFLMVMSLSSSIDATLAGIYDSRRHDVRIVFEDDEPVNRIVEVAQAVPGVDKAEMRMVHSAAMLVGGRQSKEAGVGGMAMGIPPSSDFFKPFMVAGRWLQPGDGRVLVITKQSAEKSDLRVGSRVTLDMGELGKEDWTILGLYDPVFAGGMNTDFLYASQDALFSATKKINRGTQLYVRTTQHDAVFVDDVTKRLKDVFESRNAKVAISESENEAKQANAFQFGIITSMLLMLAVIVAAVGGIALAGALSIAVVERTKEIGVLRAVGARSRSIIGMFVMEGVLQGVMSWAISVPISFLFGKPLSDALGNVMFNATLNYQYNFGAVFGWLIIVVVISAIASIMPARSATHVSVRDSLAYA
jgi:putative ABC transport system permease protein